MSRKWINLLRAVLDETTIYGPVAALRRIWLWFRKWQYRGRNRKLPTHPNPRDLPPVNAPSATHSARLRVLYVAGTSELLSRRYRVGNMCEQLNKQGIETRVVEDLDAHRLKRQLRDFDVVVLQRTVATPEIREFIQYAQASRCALAFEIDDYLFDERLFEATGMFRTLPDSEANVLKRYVLGYRETLLSCPNFIGTTQFLADEAATLRRRSYVIRNGLSDQYLSLARNVLAHRPPTISGGRSVRIGYLSGTRTHAGDFNLIVQALRRLMEGFPNIYLSLFGYIDLPGELLPFKNRVTIHRFMRWEKLIAQIATQDFIVAPLQDTPFNRAKSALKYFETAVLEVPVVASPTEDFQYAITHGVNGLLATIDDEWFDCLRDLASDADLRRRIGQAARQDVLRRYTSSAQSHHTREVMTEIARQSL